MTDQATAVDDGPSQESRATHSIEVVVVTWNSARLLEGLFSSLPRGLAGLNWQLTVVDNDSADDTVELTERWLSEHTDEIRGRVVQTGRNAGYAAAINIGLAQERAEPYTAALILNPDVRLDPGCIGHMLDLLDAPTPVGSSAQAGGSAPAGSSARAGGSAPASSSAPAVPGRPAHSQVEPKAGIVVPRILEPDGSLFHSLRRDPTIARALADAILGRRARRFPRFSETILDERAYMTTTTAAWAGGAIVLISEPCLRTCGPWDESFFLYSEETEFALRARDHGFVTRLAPRAAVTHLGGDSATSEYLWALLTFNRVRLYRLRHSLPPTFLYWCAVLLRESLRAAFGKRPNRSAAAALLRMRPPVRPSS